MCWVTGIQEHMQPIIAKDNVAIIKVLSKNDNGDYFAPYWDMRYELNKTYYSDIVIGYEDVDRLIIEHGLHSITVVFLYFKEKEVYDKNFITIDKGFYYAIMEGYIPAGATYYEDENGEIVSDSIVLTTELPRIPHFEP